MPVDLTSELILQLNNLPGFPPAADFTLGDFLAATLSGPEVVRVTQASDFPDAVSGVRTLEADKVYFISGVIDLGSDVLQLPTSGLVHIRGLSMSLDRLVTSSASALISSGASPCALSLRDIRLTNDAGPALNLDLGGTKVFAATFAIFSGCASVGTISNASNIMQFANHFIGNTDGLTVDGAVGAWANSHPIVVGSSGTAYTVPAGATFQSIYFSNGNFVIGAGTTGIDIDETIEPVDGGKIFGNFFRGAGTYITGITRALPYWQFRVNANVIDSHVIGEVDFDNNATPTVVSVTNDWYDVDGTFILETPSERFSQPSNGVLQYDGIESTQVSVRLTGAAAAATGTPSAEMAIAFNDVSAGGGFSRIDISGPYELKAATSTSFALEHIVTLETGDQIKAQTRNTTGTENIVVTSCALVAQE